MDENEHYRLAVPGGGHGSSSAGQQNRAVSVRWLHFSEGFTIDPVEFITGEFRQGQPDGRILMGRFIRRERARQHVGGFLSGAQQTNLEASGSRKIEFADMKVRRYYGAFAGNFFEEAGGFYARSSGLMTFDFESDRYLVPFGIGVGRVLKIGGAVVNAFIEPQFSAYSKGNAQPQWQAFSGINFQWFK